MCTHMTIDGCIICQEVSKNLPYVRTSTYCKEISKSLHTYMSTKAYIYAHKNLHICAQKPTYMCTKAYIYAHEKLHICTQMPTYMCTKALHVCTQKPTYMHTRSYIHVHKSLHICAHVCLLTLSVLVVCREPSKSFSVHMR